MTGASGPPPRAKILPLPHLSLKFHKRWRLDARPRDAETRYARGPLRHEAPSIAAAGRRRRGCPL